MSDGDVGVSVKRGDAPDILDGAVDWYLQAIDEDVLELEEKLVKAHDNESRQARCFVRGYRVAAWVSRKSEKMAVAPSYTAVAKKLP